MVEVAAELRCVHPRAERRPRPGEDDAADPAVPRKPLEGIGELQAKLDRERVPLLGPAQSDEGHLVVALDRKQAGHGRTLSRRCGQVQPRTTASAPAKPWR